MFTENVRNKQTTRNLSIIKESNKWFLYNAIMDYYRVLGLKSTASDVDIKKAFNRLAKKYHPDKNDASDAAERFRPIKEAYEQLKRRNDHQPIHTSSRSQKPHQNHQSSHHRTREESFFTGSSARVCEEQKYQDELARIRHINTELLEEANLKLKRRSKKMAEEKRKPTNRSVFSGEIYPDMDDESYEKLVLDRLRAFAANR